MEYFAMHLISTLDVQFEGEMPQRGLPKCQSQNVTMCEMMFS